MKTQMRILSDNSFEVDLFPETDIERAVISVLNAIEKKVSVLKKPHANAEETYIQFVVKDE